MKHLGDITKISGAEIEIVDVITGGSPCQDLSIAGKRAGLAGARSGLFMEQVRIVKEMREHDRANGRTGDMVRPRFMVWENVPGAFSSNKGRDFAAVLEEIIRIAEPEAPDIEVPEKGWPTWGGYHDEVGGRWSVAWRVHDAQYWGVPQRRRRISVVADFGGDTAGEILFERKSVSRHPAESGTAGERLAGNAENGASYAVRIRGGCDGGGNKPAVMCLTPWEAQSARVYDQDGVWHSLNANENGGMARDSVMCAGFKLGNSEQARGIGYAEEQSPTLNAECGGNKPAVMCLNDQGGNVMGVSHDVSGTLRAQEHGYQSEVMAFDTTQITSKQNGSIPDFGKPCHTLNANTHAPCAVIRDCGMVVRRLTPMEGERLQGYPDGWTDIGEWCDSKGKRHKDADSPRYKALGNSIALPFWDFLAKRISAQYLRPVTMGSLFDGIGGFPLVFERHNGKGSARWASEIEEFPIAVTKKWFGED